jgi:hypothetical protein
LTSALKEVNGQPHAPAALPPGKVPLGRHWIGGWVGLRAGLDTLEKRKTPLNSDLQACSQSLYQTKWWEYMERMEDKRIQKVFFKHNPAGKRDPERQRMYILNV